MKATTFVLRQHARIRQRIALLDDSEAHHRLADVVEEALSFLAIEEDLFYPVVAQLLERDLASVHDDLARVEAALLSLLAATDGEQLRRRLSALVQAHGEHARNDLCVVPIAERVLGERQLEELGAKMVRFYQDSVADTHNDDGGAATLH
jgi:hypothetical protein